LANGSNAKCQLGLEQLGDGIMASFVEAPASVACAIEIRQELASYSEVSKTPIPHQTVKV
jgi:hypothetical protein